MTRLDEKLARIQSGDYRRRDFIIADAKDGDMGSGITTGGPRYDAADRSSAGRPAATTWIRSLPSCARTSWTSC